MNRLVSGLLFVVVVMLSACTHMADSGHAGGDDMPHHRH